jgi:signal transduction histidine kinase
MQVIADEDSGIIQSLVRDITERKQAEKLLTLNKDRLEALVHLHHMHESSIEEIVEYTLEKAVELTGSAIALLNYVSVNADGELVPSIWSKGIIKTMVPHRTEYFAIKDAELWDDVVSNPIPQIMNDYTATHADYVLEGYADLQRVLIVPVVHEDEVVLLSAVANKDGVYDDTDRNELTLLMGGMWNHIKAQIASDELRQANEQLQELNASKDTFFSIIAHDLRGPLSSLHELTQHIEENLDNYVLEELKELIVLQKASSETLYKLLENLLTWSRVQRGVMPYQPQPINIRWFVARNIDLLTLHATKKRITLKNTVEDEVFVFADFNMVDTIIRNLVSNAIKFTEPGGAVTVSAQHHERFLEIAVADTGIGIEEEYLPTMFRIDTRYKRMGTADEEGSGLGLILCKEFVDKHHCGIWVESVVGKGTTFRFTLPKMSKEEMAARAETVVPDIVM